MASHSTRHLLATTFRHVRSSPSTQIRYLSTAPPPTATSATSTNAAPSQLQHSTELLVREHKKLAGQVDSLQCGNRQIRDELRNLQQEAKQISRENTDLRCKFEDFSERAKMDIIELECKLRRAEDEKEDRLMGVSFFAVMAGMAYIVLF
ncbi:hypothetical protein BJ508DRAFT_310974 [Ascobolus immersus RN42]|uniref:DUF1640-domain-containing protein n=1 Tax=Ascobolus immersus RN42 TaxID=1160509 RepID=A0A3N4HRX3_ASCIM|nr:hypothetical protein BJ508DRAFT_310974 [Ascobolus immersus RN42]